MKTIKFTKSPTGEFNLAYFEGDVVEFEDALAKQLMDDGYATPADEKETDQLPEDLPARQSIFDFGIKTLEDLKKIVDFTEIPGVGKATAAKIEDFLQGK
jgi:hypothetical protein